MDRFSPFDKTTRSAYIQWCHFVTEIVDAMQAVISKNERVTARLSEEVKLLLTQAAVLSGATLNQFLVQAALEKAQRMIEHENIIRLSLRNSAWFFSLLDNPPKPNAKLLQAVAAHKLGLR
jgi:uncharacterized protein (DUF1778 family)